MPVRKDAAGRYHAEACVGRKRLHRRLPVGATASDAKRVEAELIRALHTQRAVKSPAIPGDPPLTELLADYSERHALNLRSTDTAQYHAYRIGLWCEGKRAAAGAGLDHVRLVAARAPPRQAAVGAVAQDRREQAHGHAFSQATSRTHRSRAWLIQLSMVLPSRGSGSLMMASYGRLMTSASTAAATPATTKIIPLRMSPRTSWSCGMTTSTARSR